MKRTQEYGSPTAATLVRMRELTDEARTVFELRGGLMGAALNGGNVEAPRSRESRHYIIGTGGSR